MKRLNLIITLLIFSLVLLLPGQTKEQEEAFKKRLKYEVSVEAQLVPVFAVDRQGNPVYDLTPGEIELYADGKPTEIIYFSAYREEPPGKKGEQKKPSISVKSPQRINFIILDTLLSNKNIMGLSRMIAMGIIRNASPGDAFIILESNQVRGLQYVTGPERDKKKLAKTLKGIEKLFIKRRVLVSADLLKEYSQVTGNAREIVEAVWDTYRHRARRERERYQSDIRVLAQSLQQLKYALKTIILPKTVFLVSTGPMKYAMGDMPVTYYRFLEDAAKAINFGGSMFYVINPLMYRSARMRTELKFMTDQVGGKGIHGRNISEIVHKVKNSTSAYYELVFYPEKKAGAGSRIRLICKRKGVELITIGYSEKGKPYHQMNTAEKKMFALNVVNGGAWSRMVAKVGKVKYKKLKSGPAERPVESLEIRIPPAMRDRQLDVFLVCVDPQTQKAKMAIEKKVMKEKTRLHIPVMQNRNHYFVIIEPQTPLCIYNRVIF